MFLSSLQGPVGCRPLFYNPRASSIHASMQDPAPFLFIANRHSGHSLHGNDRPPLTPCSPCCGDTFTTATSSTSHVLREHGATTACAVSRTACPSCTPAQCTAEVTQPAHAL